MGPGPTYRWPRTYPRHGVCSRRARAGWWRCPAWVGSTTNTSGERREPIGRISGRHRINITARLERLADPGAVCMSAPVWDQVRHKLRLSGEDLGDQALKNIPEPIHVYQVRPGDEPARPGETRRDPDALTGSAFAARPDVAVIVAPAVWIVYVATVFEIVFMSCPFALC